MLSSATGRAKRLPGDPRGGFLPDLQATGANNISRNLRHLKLNLLREAVYFSGTVSSGTTKVWVWKEFLSLPAEFLCSDGGSR